MEEKRYSIVRVDMNNCNKCEHYYTNKEGNNDCRLRRGAYFLCARHGDTKEQMIAKVEQAIRRNVKNGVCLYTENNYIHTTDNRFFWHWVAKFIVEFLGVK